MPIASSLKHYLEKHGVKYDIVAHPRTASSMKTAEAAHVPGDRVAKTVVLKDNTGYMLAVAPATRHVDLEAVSEQLGRSLDLAQESDFAKLFKDCELGAVPPLGEAYNLDVVLDDSLGQESDIYFEAGDHVDLIHVSGEHFQNLMTKAAHGRFSYHV